MTYIFLATNDFSTERQMYSHSYLLLCLYKAIKALETESSVALIHPPPKTDPRLNEQLCDFFLFAEYYLFSQLPHVRFHKPFWQAGDIGPDGVHLNAKGQKFLIGLLNTIRRPASQPQFGIPRRPRKFLHEADEPEIMDRPYFRDDQKLTREDIIPREHRLFSYINRLVRLPPMINSAVLNDPEAESVPESPDKKIPNPEPVLVAKKAKNDRANRLMPCRKRRGSQRDIAESQRDIAEPQQDISEPQQGINESAKRARFRQPIEGIVFGSFFMVTSGIE